MQANDRTAATPFQGPAQRVIERANKREAVLLAAVRAFSKRGFHLTSLDDVAAMLHVSKPTIYYYLGNKEQVLLECVSRGFEMVQVAAVEALSEEGTGLERLQKFLIRYAEFNMADFGQCVIRTSDEMLSQEGATRFRALKRKIDIAMRDMIESAISDGSMAPADVKIAAFTLAGALNWPARWFDATGDLQPNEIAAKMVDILTAGLRAKD